MHETVDLNIHIANSDITILHHPGNSHAPRDFSLLKHAAEKGHLNMRLIRMYAKELFISGTGQDFLEAYPFFESILHDENAPLDEVRAAQCVVTHTALLRNDSVMMFKTALKNVIGGPSAEVCCDLGTYFADTGDFEEAATWYYTAASGAQSELDIHASGNTPLLCLAHCYDKLDMPSEAEDCRLRAKSWTPPQGD